MCGAAAEDVAGPRFCPACADDLERVGPGCPRCGLPGPARECGRCALHPPRFRNARAALVYREGNAVARAVQRWKYDRDEVVGAALTALFRETFAAAVAAESYDLVVPVPSDPKRLRARGFHPADALARALARGRARPVPGLLQRRSAASQVGRARREREEGAAAVATDRRIDGAHVLLVDDVYTTGATAAACVAALRDAGAMVVDVRTLAHTAPPGHG